MTKTRKAEPLYYPIGLDIQGKDCLVVGGGQIAERKLDRLLRYGAKILLVSPEVTDRIQHWIKQGRLRYKKAFFSANLIKEQTLVFAATNDEKLNETIVRLATKKRIPANSVKPGNVSTFIVPALFEKGSLNVSVSTHGRSPARARALKEKLKQLL